MGSKKKADPRPRKRGMKVSHRRRVELIEDLREMRRDLMHLENRVHAATEMIKKDYWTLVELNRLQFFKQRLKD